MPDNVPCPRATVAGRYYQAALSAGDCIFVPGDYPHQVASPVPQDRVREEIWRTMPTAKSAKGTGTGTDAVQEGVAAAKQRVERQAAEAAQDAKAGWRNIQVSFLFGGVTAFARGTGREHKPIRWDPAGCEADGKGNAAGKWYPAVYRVEAENLPFLITPHTYRS